MTVHFVPKGPIDNIPVLVQTMAWCWTGNKPLSEEMLLMHICVTLPQWVNPVLDLQKHLLQITFIKSSLKFILICPAGSILPPKNITETDILPVDDMLTRGECCELPGVSPSKCQKFSCENNFYLDKIHVYFYECRFYGCLSTMGS